MITQHVLTFCQLSRTLDFAERRIIGGRCHARSAERVADGRDGLAGDLAPKVKSLIPEGMHLQSISNRGTQVWPDSSVFTECVPHYRLRILFTNKTADAAASINELIRRTGGELTITECQWLRNYDGKQGYALAQGQ
jgi:hypothetical protein